MKKQILVRSCANPDWWYASEGVYNFGTDEFPVPMLMEGHEAFDLVTDPSVETDTIILTDAHLNDLINEKLNEKYKNVVAWIQEPFFINYQPYRFLDENIDKFSAILTHNENLISKYPDLFDYIPVGGTFISDLDFGLNLENKSKLIGMIASNKNWLKGHTLRHDIFDRYHALLDTYKYADNTGSTTYGRKADYLVPTLYSICPENCKIPGYFTEKVIDCFLTGNVPIYYGDDLSKFGFNNKGIIYIEKVYDMENVFDIISQDDYAMRAEALDHNLRHAMNFIRPYEYMYKAFQRRGIL